MLCIHLACSRLKQKPAIALAIAGFWKSLSSGLEASSHDAVAARAAMPYGRLSGDSLVTNANLNRGNHLLTSEIHTITNDLSSEAMK
jgi:hypothetical protein